MRRYLAKFLLFACVLFVGTGHVAAQRVPWSDVPKEVVESFYLAHPRSEWKIVHWELADMGYVSRINLEPKEISSLFQANGEWVSTRRVVPESQLPLFAHDFISEKYAFYTLRSCTYEEDRWQGRHYYALLSIYGIEGYLTEVCFDLKGNVVSIDGEEIEDLDEFEPLTEEEVLRLQQNEMFVDDELRLVEETRQQSHADSVKQEKRQRKMIYKPQTRRQFIAAKVSVQSKRARQQMEDENDSLTTEKQAGTAAKPVEPRQEIAVDAREAEREAPSSVASPESEERGAVVAVNGKESSEVPVSEAKPVTRMENMVSGMEGGRLPTTRMSVKNLFPASVQKVFDHRFPKAENVKQYRDTNGDYRAIFMNFGQRAEAVILADGTHTTTALFFGKKDISYPIMQYILNSPEKYRFETGKRVVYESRYRQRFPAEKKPKNYYEIVVWIKDKATKERKYFMLTFDHKAHFVSKVPYDYSKLR